MVLVKSKVIVMKIVSANNIIQIVMKIMVGHDNGHKVNKSVEIKPYSCGMLWFNKISVAVIESHNRMWINLKNKLSLCHQ